MKKIALMLMATVVINAASLAEVNYNKKVAFNYCSNLAGVGSATENISMNKYEDICLSLIKYPFNVLPSMEEIRVAINQQNK
jgi:hypothetical protein